MDYLLFHGVQKMPGKPRQETNGEGSPGPRGARLQGKPLPNVLRERVAWALIEQSEQLDDPGGGHDQVPPGGVKAIQTHGRYFTDNPVPSLQTTFSRVSFGENDATPP